MSLDSVLFAREERWLLKRKIASEGGRACVCLTLRMPYAERTRPDALAFFKAARQKFEKICIEPLSRSVFCNSDDGPYQIWTVDNSERAKRAAIEFEETNPYGEMCDIDVLAPDLFELSRRDMSLMPRSCFVCKSRPARECISENRHTKEETIQACKLILARLK